MTGEPRITHAGAGSRREAARIGHEVADAVASQVARSGSPVHIETLRLRLPAGASQRQVEQAVRQALARQTKETER